MNKGILITASIFLLLILSIIAVSAIVIYSSNDQRVVYIKPSLNINNQGYDYNTNTITEKTDYVSQDSTPKPCYNMLSQEKGCSPYVEVEQDRTPCTKTVTLSCGKQVTVSCDLSIDQIKGCGHLDTPEQTKDYCYKTITLPCGKTMQVQTSCLEKTEQVRGYPCYDTIDQVRNDCVNKVINGGCNSEKEILMTYSQNSCSSGYKVMTTQQIISQDHGNKIVYYGTY